MITVRPSAERGHFDHGWLDTYHTFSFGEYRDRNWMGFGPLRVINEDRVAPGQGFGMHPHSDMEIVTYVLSGQLEHRDSMGHQERIEAGRLQRMTAGSGILHSEYNPSESEETHLLQIWLRPSERGLEPSYEERTVDLDGSEPRLALLASPTGRDGSLTIHQDAEIYSARLPQGGTLAHAFASGRLGWLQVTRGALTVNGQSLAAGDGAAMENVAQLELSSDGEAEALLFDMG